MATRKPLQRRVFARRATHALSLALKRLRKHRDEPILTAFNRSVAADLRHRVKRRRAKHKATR